jgi:glycosyltransferase involved in cell wall biosynthesis
LSVNKPSISVLIPNYDWNVTSLIRALHDQLTELSIQFEIICFDNAQNSQHRQANEQVNQLHHTTYRVNAEQTGRAQNRNALAQAAQCDLLLFLDGDAGLDQKPLFIADYLASYEPGIVVCGGTAYGKKPSDPSLLLRYTYGIHREQLSAAKRNENPWAGFSAFNFLMERHAFMQFGFDEQFSEYGHEDTLFGNELKYRCIPIKHIDNAAEHLGLDSSKIFLEKSKQAVENLRDLINAGQVDEDTRLYAWYARVRKSMMTAVIGALYHKFQGKWEKNLCGPHPNLRTFDLYRLGYLCTLPIIHKSPPAKRLRSKK